MSKAKRRLKSFYRRIRGEYVGAFTNRYNFERRLPKKGSKLKFLILGHPRTGTGFMSKLFQHNGWDVGHEIIGKDGTANWVYAIKDDRCFEWVLLNRNDLDWEIVIHNVRDPYAAITSVFLTETAKNSPDSPEVAESEAFRKKYLDIPNTGIINKVAASFIGWNKIIADQNPEFTVRVERAFADLKESGFLKKDLKNKKVNARHHAVVSKEEWGKLDKDLLNKLDDFCAKYGYLSLSERLKSDPA